jgi:hypothetical protein
MLTWLKQLLSQKKDAIVPFDPQEYNVKVNPKWNMNN